MPAEESGDFVAEASAEDAEIYRRKTLVVYYTATGYMESVATYIAGATGEWLISERFRSSVSEEAVREWVESLSLK